MTPEELDELVGDCPELFHMAERGGWKGISENGLLSTTSLLDLYKIGGADRHAIESVRRDHCVPISGNGLPPAIIRDQLPMDDQGLLRCLPEEITPSDWYRFLNKKVFFWFTKDRLHRLTNAKAYRDMEHEVLVLDTKRLIKDYAEKIWLCPINSGCTKPMPHPRDFKTFSRINDYPYAHWRAKRKRGERAVELCIDEGVPNILDYVKNAFVIQGDTELSRIK